MSELMNLLNEADRKLAHAQESAGTAYTMSNSVADAASQTRHRQEEIQEIAHSLRVDLNPAAASDQLEHLNSCCPEANSINVWAKETQRMHSIAALEMVEARELLAKAREMEGTRIA